MKYTLEGIDGNAFSVIAYVVDAMKKEKCQEEDIEFYRHECMFSDYRDLLCSSLYMLDVLNKRNKP